MEAVTTHRLQNLLRQVLTAMEYSQKSNRFLFLAFFLLKYLSLHFHCSSSSTTATPAQDLKFNLENLKKTRQANTRAGTASSDAPYSVHNYIQPKCCFSSSKATSKSSSIASASSSKMFDTKSILNCYSHPNSTQVHVKSEVARAVLVLLAYW